MTSMIERVGRAIAEANQEDYMEFAALHDAMARAAIEAMKRPVTDDMIEAGTNAIHNGQNVSEIFDDMIDAALKEKR